MLLVTTSLILLFNNFWRSYPSWVFFQLWIVQKTLHTLLAANIQPLPSVESFLPYAHLQQQFLSASLRSTTLRLHLACALLARLLCPTALWGNENKIKTIWALEMQPWILVDALLADTSTTLLAEIFTQIEKQLKLIPLSFPLRFQTQNMKSYTHHIKTNV